MYQPDSILYQHTVFCQTGLPYRDPGHDARATLAPGQPATALPDPDFHRLERTSFAWRTIRPNMEPCHRKATELPGGLSIPALLRAATGGSTMLSTLPPNPSFLPSRQASEGRHSSVRATRACRRSGVLEG
jgi:hypothetical protein